MAAMYPAVRPARVRMEDRLEMTQELVEAYFQAMAEKGRKMDTLETYRRYLDLFYDWLPEGKVIRRDTLSRWRESLMDAGYAARTVNTAVSTLNSFLEYCGHREFQVGKPLEPEDMEQPELTRAEYLRLLSAARALGKRRSYLLIKVLGNTELGLVDLHLLTVEAAREGCVGQTIPIPDCLAEQLLEYAAQEGIISGPIFVTRDGKSMARSAVTTSIQVLARDARVAREKATPRCLKKLYLSTRGAFIQQLSVQLNRKYTRLLEKEEKWIGWD